MDRTAEQQADGKDTHAWREQLRLAAAQLRREGLFTQSNWAIFAGVIAFILLQMTGLRFLMCIGLLAAAGIALRYLISHEEAWIAARLDESDLAGRLVDGKLDLTLIRRYTPRWYAGVSRLLPDWYEFSFFPRQGEELRRNLHMLVANLDWHLKPPRRLLRLSHILLPLGHVLMVLGFILGQLLLPLQVDSPLLRAGTFSPFWMLGCLSGLLFILLPYCLRKACTVVWANALFRSVSRELGTDLVTGRDDLSMGAADLLSQLDAKTRQLAAARTTLMIITSLAAVVIFFICWGRGIADPVGGLMGAVAIGGAITLSALRQAHYRRELVAALNGTSLAVKLVSGEFAQEHFEAFSQLQARAWGALAVRQSFIRDAMILSFELERYLVLPRPTNIMVAALLGGLLLAVIGSDTMRNFSDSFGTGQMALWPTLLGWGYLVALDYFNMAGTRMITMLRHLQDHFEL